MKTIIFDMYGVIIKESKGNFLPYTYSHFPAEQHSRITKLIREDKLFTKASNGEIDSHTFLTALGFDDPDTAMHDYIDNYLTLDYGFISFCEKFKDKFAFSLLSNDLSDWSGYITEHYNLNKYFTDKVVSGDVLCRKPDIKIYNIALSRLSSEPNECIFIDNSVENLTAASSLGLSTILFNRDMVNYNGITVYTFDELIDKIEVYYD